MARWTGFEPAGKLKWPDSLIFELAISILAGFVYALLVLGAGPLNPFNTKWLQGDSALYYIGWSLFRHDPHLHWPLTFTERLGYPIGESVAMLDVNPPLALFFKLFSPLLPTQFQYLGIQCIVACSLQFFFAVRIFRVFLGRNPLVLVLSSTFLLISPVLCYRMASHQTLTNQWEITAALYVFVLLHRSPGLSAKRISAVLALLTGLSVATNPYIAIQVLLVAIAALAGLVWRKRVSLRFGIATLVIMAIVCFASASVFGFLMAGGKGSSGGGYRLYSMNLLAPLDTVQRLPTWPRPAGFGTLLIPALPEVGVGQYEGYSYLGLGAMALAGVCLYLVVFSPKRPRIERKLLITFLTCCAALTLLALSTQITFGSRVLIDLDPSQKLTPLLSVFRSCGRLFWTPYYALLVAIVIVPFLCLGPRGGTLLVAAALTLQIADTAPLRRGVYAVVNPAPENPLPSPIWSSLGSRYRHLVIMPPWQCGYEASPGGKAGFETFGLLAASQKMTINSYNSGRQSERMLSYHCGTSIHMLTREPLAADTAYVVIPTLASRIAAGGLGRCHHLDDFVLCSAHDDFGLPPENWPSQSELFLTNIFRTVLLRDPTQQELSKWASAIDSHALSAHLVSGLLNSDEFQRDELPRLGWWLTARGRFPSRTEWLTKAQSVGSAALSAQDRNRALVWILYLAILKREPDPSGFEAWSHALAQTTTDQIAMQLFDSPEYKVKLENWYYR